jgi:hypothetical protein
MAGGAPVHTGRQRGPDREEDRPAAAEPGNMTDDRAKDQAEQTGGLATQLLGLSYCQCARL